MTDNGLILVPEYVKQKLYKPSIKALYEPHRALQGHSKIPVPCNLKEPFHCQKGGGITLKVSNLKEKELIADYYKTKDGDENKNE